MKTAIHILNLNIDPRAVGWEGVHRAKIQTKHLLNLFRMKPKQPRNPHNSNMNARAARVDCPHGPQHMRRRRCAGLANLGKSRLDRYAQFKGRGDNGRV